MTRRKPGGITTGILSGLLLFAAFLAWRFPTDAVVHRALARATPPGGPAVVFGRAALRPGGVRLDDVAVRAPTGDLLLRVERVRLWPSFRGLLRDGRGLPCAVEAIVCGGTAEGTVAADGAATTIALTWRDADLAACPPLPIAAGALAGRARGAAWLRLRPSAPPEGSGSVDLEAGTWQGGGTLAAFGVLHAESASVRWALRDGRLALEALELHGPDVSARGSGEVHLADPLEESRLALRLAIAPVPDASGPLGILLRLATRGVERRHLTVAGTLARPSAALQ